MRARSEKKTKVHERAALHFVTPIWTPRGERRVLYEGEASWAPGATPVVVGQQMTTNGPQAVLNHETVWHIEFPLDAPTIAQAKECITVRVPFSQAHLSQPLVKLGEGREAQWVPLSKKQERERALLIAKLPRVDDEERGALLRAWLASRDPEEVERLAMETVARFDEELLAAAGDVMPTVNALRRGFVKRDAAKRGLGLVTGATEH